MSDHKQSVIFIVDDNPDNIKVLAKVLASYGYKTLVAMDGLSGIQKIIKAQPDLILLDILMPNIDGLQTCKLLKENEITRHIPIIFMTALASTDDKVKGLKAGAVDYITKPFQQDELIARLELHLELRRLSYEIATKNHELQAEIDLRLKTEMELRKQFEREQLVTEITLNIRQSLDLSTILNTAVTSLKEVLNVDRVLVYQVLADGTGKVVAEAVNEELDKILDIVFPQEIFPEEAYQKYLKGGIYHFNDCTEMSHCLQDFLQGLGVKSKLAAPILTENRVWGLIIAHQHTSYQWQQWQSDLVSEVSNQLAIAIFQASLYQQAQSEILHRQKAEEKLVQISNRLSLAVKSAEIGIWEWDVVNNILFWDKRMYELYGINRERFQDIYEAWANTLHPDDRQITEEAVQLALAGEKDYACEFRVIQPNGSIQFIQANGLVERDAQGSPLRMVGINYDITERRLAEANQLLENIRKSAIAAIALAIREFTDIQKVLDTAVSKIREILVVDRALIYKLLPDQSGLIQAEDLTHLSPIKNLTLPPDRCLIDHLTAYEAGRIYILHNIQDIEGSAPCLADFLRNMGVNAEIALPIIQNNMLWGLLIVQHGSVRQWQDWEIELLREIGNQLAIALNQATLYTELQYELQERKQMGVALQALNQDLELRVWQRTAALASSEQRLERIVANIADGIVVSDANGMVVFANPSAKRMFGIEQGESHNFKLNIPFIESTETAIEILSEHNRIAEIQKVEIDWDGKKHYLASIRDITEREQKNEQLRELLKQIQDYKYALDQAAIIYITDAAGDITYANDNFYHLTGYDSAEVIGFTPRLVNSQYHPPEFYSHMWSEISSGKVWHGEIKNQSKDKTYYWIDITIIPFTNQNGKIEQYLAIQFNISDRKLIEEERQKLDLLVKNSSEFIAIADLEGNITYLNEAGKLMIGIEGLNLGNLHDYLKPAIHSPENILSDALLQGAYEGECFINHLPTDTSIPTLCNIFLIKDRDGTPISIGAVFRDISKLKQAESEIMLALEKEKELSMLRSNFVSMASHELRTPLAIVSSSAGILETYSDRLTDAKKSQHLQRIQTSIKHMTELIDDVLILNRAEVGRVEFHPETLDIVSFCRNLNEEIQLGTIEHKLEFSSQVDSILTPIDTKLIRQILTNILTNAIKYTPQGGVVKFDLSVTAANVVFQITDSGIGMSPEDLAALFSSFHRGSNVGIIPGNGLGLAIVKKCVDLHQGQISVQSEIGTGSMFEVTLPLSISP